MRRGEKSCIAAYSVLVSEELLDERIVLQKRIDNDATHEAIELTLAKKEDLLVVFEETRLAIREREREREQWHWNNKHTTEVFFLRNRRDDNVRILLLQLLVQPVKVVESAVDDVLFILSNLKSESELETEIAAQKKHTRVTMV